MIARTPTSVNIRVCTDLLYVVYLHASSYIWGHRWNAEVELPPVGWKGWKAITDGGDTGECASKGAERDPIPANSFPQEPLCHSQRVRIKLMMEIVT